MLDSLFTPHGLRTVATLAILAGALYSFVREKLPPDVTALLALLALLITGVLTQGEAFGGFSHPATVSVAAVLVLSAGVERTGVLTLLARRVLVPFARSELLFTAVIMVVIGGISAFINNTAAVCSAFGRDPGEFTRTPKLDIRRGSNAPEPHALGFLYRSKRGFLPLLELGLAAYAPSPATRGPGRIQSWMKPG